MPNTKVGTTWAPDIRPEKIETFEETYTPEGGEEQTLTYRAVDHHPILGSVLDKLAFFRTHVGAVWYNLAERKTLLAKLNEMDEELREVNAKMESFDQAKSTIINSALGKALGMTSSTALATVASKVAGIANRGTWTNTITASNGKATIPLGYHNGNGYVQVSGLYVSPTTQNGSISVENVVAGVTIQKTVTFPKAFTTAPKVNASANGIYNNNPYALTVTISSISKAGFTANIKNPLSSARLSSIVLVWNAVV